MIGRSTGALVYQLQRVAADFDAAVPDSALLQRFQQFHDPAAFELLVWRHGAMVQAVCRRVLGHGAEVDDAFQATFLVLLQQSRSIRNRHSLASWLHGVALRVALRCRRDLLTRRQHERAAGRSEVQSPSDLDRSELGPVLHAEIARLPERLRQPFVLCEIEGRSNAEAAELLSVPDGTVRSRLSRARERLRRRLVQRGVAFGAAGLASAIVVEPVSAALVASTIQTTLHSSAITTIPGAASALAKGVIQDMFARKLKIACAFLLATSIICLAGISSVPRLLNLAHAGDNPEAAKPQPPAQPQQPPAAAKGADQATTPDKPNQPSALEQLVPTKPLQAYDPMEAGLIGYWKLKEATVNGELRDPDETALAIGPFGTMYVVKGVGGDVQVPMTYQIRQIHPRAGVEPAIDLIADGKTESGIFGLSRRQSDNFELLRICLAAKGSELPITFSSLRGSNKTLLSFDRVPNRYFDTKWAEKMFVDGLKHDFGSVSASEKPVYQFKFKNVFDRPVRVYDCSSDAQLGKEVEALDPTRPGKTRKQTEYSSLHLTAQPATKEWIEPGQVRTIQFQLESVAPYANLHGGSVNAEIRVSFVVKGLDQLQKIFPPLGSSNVRLNVTATDENVKP